VSQPPRGCDTALVSGWPFTWVRWYSLNRPLSPKPGQ